MTTRTLSPEVVSAVRLMYREAHQKRVEAEQYEAQARLLIANDAMIDLESEQWTLDLGLGQLTREDSPDGPDQP